MSRKGDVYSYGILLLEILTGKSPTDVMFEGELNLRKWVHDAYPSPSTLISILDKNLNHDAISCLDWVVKIALECSAPSPNERISMQDVVPRLKKIIDELTCIYVH